MPQPTLFQRQLEQLSRNSARAVMGTFDSMRAAGMATGDIVDTLTPVLMRAAGEGETLARAELARMLARIEQVSIADAMPPVVSIPTTSAEVKSKALTTALADEVTARSTLQLLAQNDPIETAQQAMSLSMRASRRVAGWVRVLDSDACELCQWLYKDGYIYPPDRPLTTHPGCICSARPVTAAELIESANRRYPDNVHDSDSTRRRNRQQRELWQQRAETAAADGSSSREWRAPGDDDDGPAMALE